jgi:N-lysine methyltransferase SETD6
MGMVPMADVLNADAEFNAHLSHGEDTLTMTTLRDIKAGEEVLNYYGPLPNGELLRRYGYTSSRHTRYDVVEISWNLVKQVLSDHKFDAQNKVNEQKLKQNIAKFLADMEADDESGVQEGFLLDRDSGEPNEEGLLSSEAKFTKFPDELVEVISELISTLSKSISGKRKLDDDSTKTMLKLEALQIMQEIVTARHGQYSTSASDDEALMSTSSLSRRLRMAIDVRLGEKRLLKEALDWVSEKQRSLTSKNTGTKQKKTKR